MGRIRSGSGGKTVTGWFSRICAVRFKFFVVGFEILIIWARGLRVIFLWRKCYEF